MEAVLLELNASRRHSTRCWAHNGRTTHFFAKNYANLKDYFLETSQNDIRNMQIMERVNKGSIRQRIFNLTSKLLIFIVKRKLSVLH